MVFMPAHTLCKGNSHEVGLDNPRLGFCDFLKVEVVQLTSDWYDQFQQETFNLVMRLKRRTSSSKCTNTQARVWPRQPCTARPQPHTRILCLTHRCRPHSSRCNRHLHTFNMHFHSSNIYNIHSSTFNRHLLRHMHQLNSIVS